MLLTEVLLLNSHENEVLFRITDERYGLLIPATTTANSVTLASDLQQVLDRFRWTQSENLHSPTFRVDVMEFQTARDAIESLSDSENVTHQTRSKSVANGH